MPQVLKDEVFERIFQAGVDVFYEKDYRSAKMQEIADKAGIPVSLIYNYHKNKEELFDKIASSLRINFEKLLQKKSKLRDFHRKSTGMLLKSISLICWRTTKSL